MGAAVGFQYGGPCWNAGTKREWPDDKRPYIRGGTEINMAPALASAMK